MGIADNPKYRRINQDIAAGRFYESLQHVMSSSQRAASGKRYMEAYELLQHYASVYAAAGEHAQSLELMDEYISIARTAEQPFSDTNVDHFISVFNSIVEALESASGEISGPLDRESVLSKTFKIMEKAIELSKSPKLYLCLGKYHMDRHQLSQAQKYLAHAQDVELLFSVVSTWAAHVQEHEKPMVYLRCVLIQLASGDFSGAKCLLLMLNADFENPDELPLPLQMAHILTEMCDQPDYQLFKLVCKTYKPIVDADTIFPRLIYHLSEHLFPGQYDPNNPIFENLNVVDNANNPIAAMLRAFM